MHRRIAPIFVFLIAVSACSGEGADRALRLTGSGDITTQTRVVDPFSEIVFASEGDVEIRQGSGPSVEVVTDSDLHDSIDVEVAGGVLTISTRSGVDLDPAVAPRFVVGAGDIARIAIVGAGDVAVERLRAVDVILEISGAGDLVVADLDVDTVEVRVPGAGDVVIAGSARLLLVEWRGAGSLDASGLRSNEARVRLDGVAGIELGSIDSLSVEGSGSGGVRYRGVPTLGDSTGGSISVESSGP